MRRTTGRAGLLVLVAMAASCGGNSRRSRAPDAGGWTTVPPAHDGGRSDAPAADGKATRDAALDADAKASRDAGTDAKATHDAGADAKTTHDASVDVKTTHDAGADAKTSRDARQPIGGDCATIAECATGFCINGVCCNAACRGACVSCVLPGSVGTCLPVAAGRPDPRATCTNQGVASCGQNGTCNGVGGCALYAAESACAPSVCTGNVWTPPATCDGAGVCVTGPSLPCAPYTCVEGACYADCVSPAECVTGSTCVDSSCMPIGSLGGLCSASAECLSGVCAQGVCCASTCERCLLVLRPAGEPGNLHAGAGQPTARRLRLPLKQPPSAGSERDGRAALGPDRPMLFSLKICLKGYENNTD